MSVEEQLKCCRLISLLNVCRRSRTWRAVRCDPKRTYNNVVGWAKMPLAASEIGPAWRA